MRLLAGPTADRADPGRQAGLMFRESLDQDARFVMIEVTSGHGVRLNRRTAASGVATATDVPVADATARPIWLRVVRAGNKLTAFIAEDEAGKEFRQAGDPITLDGFTGPGFVGLALSPHTGVDARPTGGLELGQAQFDNLSVK